MKLSAGTVATLLFTAVGTAAFVWMAKRPAVDITAMNFGMPIQTTASSPEKEQPEKKAEEAVSEPEKKTEEASKEPSASEEKAEPVEQPKTEEEPATETEKSPEADSSSAATTN